MAVTKDRSSAPTPVVNGPTKHSKIWPLEFYRSAVGKKWVMAITGLIGVGFVVTHMIGNLKVYMGADDLNHYGEFLRELLYPLVPRTATLWIMRFALIGAVLLHLHAAYSLTVMNHRARPTDYAGGRSNSASSTSAGDSDGKSDAKSDSKSDTKGDGKKETEENFFVDLSAPVNATIGDGHAVGTIKNDD